MAGQRIAGKKTIRSMISLYQRRCPDAQADVEHYQALNAYADKRLDKCVFGEEKPACKQCPVHCYQPAKREEMKQIMRWAGPRMLWRHPILTIRHLIDDRRPVPELPEKYRPKNAAFRRAAQPGYCVRSRSAGEGVSRAGPARRRLV
jgi:hypothetical protein